MDGYTTDTVKKSMFTESHEVTKANYLIFLHRWYPLAHKLGNLTKTHDA